MQKVLIIRFSSIGDIVLTSPVIRCLKTQRPNIELHYLTKKAFAPILESNPHLNKVYSFDPKQESLSSIISRLKTEQYHYIIDLHKNLRSQYIAYQLGVKRFSFNKLNVKKWLLTQFKIDWMPNVHIVDRYLDSLQPLQIKNDDKGLDYYIPPSAYLPLQDFDPRLTKESYIVFVIGAAHFTKRLPATKIEEICRSLSSELIVLIGGKGDLKAAQTIEKAGKHIVNLCGQLNLHQSAAVVQQARLVVAHDTGFMHIAAALKRPILVIWGNTVPQFGMYPYLPAQAPKYSSIEHPNLSCRPCSKIGHKECPKGHFKCMQELDNKRIVTKIQTFFQKKS